MSELDVARIAHYWLREQVNTKANYGVVPGSGTPMTLNLVSESHVGDTVDKTSATAKANLLTGATRRTGISGSGGIDVEMAPGSQMDEMLEVGIGGIWSADLGISSTDIQFIASDNSLNAVGSDLDNVLPYTWLQILDTDNPLNTGRAWVTSKPAANKAICAYASFVDEAAAAATVRIFSKRVQNGTDYISSSLERHHTDATATPFQGYTGLVCQSFELTMNAQDIITAKFDFVSKGPTARSATSIFDALPTPSAPEVIVDSTSDASNHMRAFRSNGALDGNVMKFVVKHDHNVTPIPRCQELTVSGMSPGTKKLSGSLDGYLVEADGRPTRAFSYTPDEFHVEIVPDAGPIYVVTVFRAKFSGLGDTPKDGNEGPVNLNLTWNGEESPSATNVWLQVCSFPQS